MKCEYCGRFNKDAEMCKSCGAPLSSNVTIDFSLDGVPLKISPTTSWKFYSGGGRTSADRYAKAYEKYIHGGEE